MARLLTSGLESGTTAGEGLTTVGTAPTMVSTPANSGVVSAQFATSGRLVYTVAGALARTYYIRGYSLLPASPAAAIYTMWGGNAADTSFIGFKVSATRTISLASNLADPAASDTTVLDLNTYYRFELRLLWGTGAVDEIEGRVYAGDSTTPLFTLGPLTGQAVSDAAINFVYWAHTNGYWDDLAVNDDQGAENNSWVGPIIRPAYVPRRLPLA